MATKAQVESVAAIIRAFAHRDADAFASRMTEDVVLHPSAFISGRGEYIGREGVREGFAEMERGFDERGERARIAPVDYYGDADADNTVMALCEVTITREDGTKFGTEIAYLCTMEGDLMAELATWLDHKEGLRQLGQPVKLPRA